MSKVIFDDKQIKLLAKNPNVLKVSDKAITYSEEFKNRFVEENQKGILPRKIFEDNGFEVYERDSGRLIQDVFNEFNERQIHTLKAVINSALESVINNKPLFVTSNSNSEATHDCVREYVSKYDLDHAVVIQLSNLNEEFKKQIGDVIKNEKCDHLVLIEPDSFSKQMQQDVVDFALENNLKVDSYYAQPEVEISLQMKGMVN